VRGARAESGQCATEHLSTRSNTWRHTVCSLSSVHRLQILADFDRILMEDFFPRLYSNVFVWKPRGFRVCVGSCHVTNMGVSGCFVLRQSHAKSCPPAWVCLQTSPGYSRGLLAPLCYLGQVNLSFRTW
jgi:hypothetical protein